MKENLVGIITTNHEFCDVNVKCSVHLQNVTIKTH